MLNLYKNNLSVLSELTKYNLLYYDDENKLYVEDRLFTFIRGKNDIKKILNIINNSFYKYFNNYSLFYQSQNNINNSTSVEIITNEDIIVNLLKKSIFGLKIYKDTLESYKIESQIDKLITNFENCLINQNISLDLSPKPLIIEGMEIKDIDVDNMDEKKEEIEPEEMLVHNEVFNEIKDEKDEKDVKDKKVEIKEEKADESIKDIIDDEGINSKSEIIYINNNAEENKIVNYSRPNFYDNNTFNKEEKLNDKKEKKQGYVSGFIYIVCRKIVNLAKYIGNKIRNIFN
jgi:hypothetical protein